MNGTPKEIFKPEILEEIYGFNCEVIENNGFSYVIPNKIQEAKSMENIKVKKLTKYSLFILVLLFAVFSCGKKEDEKI